jgi:hypothetical protein
VLSLQLSLLYFKTVNPSLRFAVTLLALVIGLPPLAEAGPFRDFFRKVRRTFTQSKNIPRSHKTVRRQASDTPPTHSTTIAENRATSRPPDGRNTRAAIAAQSKKSTSSDLPFGTPVPGKKGFVTSPFAPASGYVDVRDFPPGTQVRDPYSGRIFLTP